MDNTWSEPRRFWQRNLPNVWLLP